MDLAMDNLVASNTMDVKPSPGYSSPLSVVCSFWKEFDLENVRTKLDEVGLRVAELQEESSQNRRRLADATKEVKRASESISKPVSALLKQYQEEIDKLSKRAKLGESAFLDLYQKLFEAPDPAPALAQAFETASRVSDLEAQCSKLSQELGEYITESSHLKNQELTIRKLEEKVRSLEGALEDKDQLVRKAREEAAAQADAAAVKQMQEREAQLTEMLAEAQSSLATMQKLHHASQNQLFAIQSQTEAKQAGQESELELASLELERAQERLWALEREKASLQEQLEGKRGAQGREGEELTVGSSRLMEEALREELNTQREVSGRLRLEVAGLKQQAEEAEEVWTSRVEGLRSALQAQEAHSQTLEQELRMRPSQKEVDDLKQQVRMLQAVKYNAIEAEDGLGSGPTSSLVDPLYPSSASSLESLLLKKNRHVEHELTMAKLKLADQTQLLDQATARTAELEAQIVEKQELINRLEDDLAAAGSSGRHRSGGGPPGGAPGSGALRSMLSGTADDQDLGGEGDESSRSNVGASSMVRVLCGQRDRLRQRLHEVEDELNKVKQDLQSVRSELAAARSDNVALVERLRYVHGYSQQVHQRRPGGDVEQGDVEKKYSKLYDEHTNPFKEFQGQQKELRRKQMNYSERAMYSLGQLVFGNAVNRSIVFCYLAFLHILVFASVSRMLHHSSQHVVEHHQSVLDNPHDMMAHMTHDVHNSSSTLP